ncbi:MAG TPA: hypothetical protein DCL44_03965 [Elusimicrobia bacterium]|nr:hypothetical protein [Elusimicrobiota bacterium]
MKIEPLNDLNLLRETGESARRLGFELYAVGGCARDWLLGFKSADIDFLCGAEPMALVDGVTRKFGGSFTNFKRFLTTRLFLADGRRLDFAVFRKESYSKPAALPVVSPAASASEDLIRRDFACNALAVSLLPASFGEVLDPYGGANDIKLGVLRILHKRSFLDDPTRIYRAARFVGRFGWKLGADTHRLALEALGGGLPAQLSRERLRNELLKLLSEKEPLPAFNLLKELDALKFFHEKFTFGPEAAAASGPVARLAVLSSALGQNGKDFIASLKLTRAMVREIMEE